MLASSLPLYVKEPGLILQKNHTTEAETGSRRFAELFRVRLFLVQHIVAHDLLRGGGGGKHRATRLANFIKVQYSIDEYTYAACVTAHTQGCIHRLQ